MSYFQKLYENGELPHRAKLVYLYLHDRMDKERKAWPGIKTLSLIHISEPTRPY